MKRVTLGAVVVVTVSVVALLAFGPGGFLRDAAAKPPAASHGPKKTSGPTTAPTVRPTSLPTPTPGSTLPPSPAAAAILVGAGDIASCSSGGDDATAALLDTVGGTVFTLGDNAYESGTTSEFNDCYGPNWGRDAIRSRTRPVPGNHDYNTAGATGYYGYYGAAAGDPTKGYYAYDQGTWRVYVLNSNCASIGGCDAGSAQAQWLRGDLATNPRACVVAMWHHPRFSSGQHGSSTATQALWQALYDANAELVLTGHDHLYERFAPQTATGVADPARGLTEIIVGTGGRSHYAFVTIRANSVVRNNDTFGVLRLSLAAGSWAFLFVPEAGKTFSDSGSGTCH